MLQTARFFSSTSQVRQLSPAKSHMWTGASCRPYMEGRVSMVLSDNRPLIIALKSISNKLNRSCTASWCRRTIGKVGNICRLEAKGGGRHVPPGTSQARHSQALSCYCATRRLLAAGFPPWPGAPLLRRPGPAWVPYRRRA
uniref:Uncharacterized protein n=1 Tax=Schistocephalus solidus TaxID=70667 RepID=A0A0X3PHW3_SCHSO